MISLLVGLVVLVVVVNVMRWYANADVADIKKSFRWFLVMIGLVGVAYLAATGKIGAALTALAALMAWAWRIFSMIQMGRQFGGMFRSFRFGQGGGSTQSSEVDSAFLSMVLDHGTGAMDGQVKQGRFQGRRLASLSREDLVSLLQDVQSDADSIGLLEAYLDRTHPEWRAGTKDERGASVPASAMTEDEALRILGLKPGAGDGDIKAAYRRLMAQLHPDHGGSDYLAAKVNQAKDFLQKGRGAS